MQDEVAMYWRAIDSSVDRLLDCLDGLSEAELDWRPQAEGANSLAVLAIHTMGNVQHHLLTILCGHERKRDRDAEFVVAGLSTEAILERWRSLRAQVDDALRALDGPALDRQCTYPDGAAAPGREVMLVVARHAAEHAGQAELTRDLLRRAGAPAG